MTDSWFRPSTTEKTRESPNDLMTAFVEWQKQNPERRITVKAFAIIRGKKDSKKKV